MDEIEIVLPERSSDALSEGLYALAQAIDESGAAEVNPGFLGGRYGYGASFQNDTFFMRPDYQDDECTCGHSERAEAWHEANPHAQDCYSRELRRRFAEYDEASGYNAIDAATRAPGMWEEKHEPQEIEMLGVKLTGMSYSRWRTPAGEDAHKRWCKAHDARNREHDKIARALCREHRIPWNNGRGSRVHCTCGKSERAAEWFAANTHTPECHFSLPNFRFKPTGFEVRWYKYIGRDMRFTGEPPTDVGAMLDECVRSFAASSKGER